MNILTMEPLSTSKIQRPEHELELTPQLLPGLHLPSIPRDDLQLHHGVVQSQRGFPYHVESSVDLNDSHVTLFITTFLITT